MAQLKFPEGFLWGSSVWDLGVEGGADLDGRTPNVFDEGYREHPERFVDQIGPAETLNWREDHKRFIDALAKLRHGFFRTSIQWSRLIPDGKHVSESAVEFYRQLFSDVRANGMELSVVLYWFDMPLIQEKRGGFTTREIQDDFVHYCSTCFDLFDDLVDIWHVYNEPNNDVYMKYALRKCYPWLRDWDLVCKATYNMVVAHAAAVVEFKKKLRHARIGSVLNHSHVYPRINSTEDLSAAEEFSAIELKSFEDPILAGRVNSAWMEIVRKSGVELEVREGDSELLAEGKVSLLGVNVYSPVRVQYESAGHPPIERFEDYGDARLSVPAEPLNEYRLHAIPYVDPDAKYNKDRGWEILPRVIYDSLMDIERDYPGTEMCITENGMGVQNESRFRNDDGMIEDDYRIEYLRDHIAWVHKAIEDGAHVTGYGMWSSVDLWSPSHQFQNCYGLLEYELGTGVLREKKSAQWYRRVAELNALEI